MPIDRGPGSDFIILGRIWLIGGLLAVLIFLGCTYSQAAIPSPAYGIQHTPYVSYSLGDVCYSLPDWNAHLPCNPAFIAWARPTGFYLAGYASGNLQHYQDIDALLKGDTNKNLVRSFFEDGRSYEAHANLEVGTYTENFGLSITPTRYYLFDYISNPALPSMTLLALREQSASLQLGGFSSPEWAFGVQGRVAQREYIYSELYLTDLWAENGNSVLMERNRQSAFYIEPGLIYAPEGYDWNPLGTLTITNLGWANEKSPIFSTKPHLHFGGSISHHVEHGNFKMGIDAHVYDETSDLASVLRMGFMYNYDSIYSTFSFGRWDYNTGFGYRGEYGSAGISYWRRNFADPYGNSKSSTEDIYLYLAVGYRLNCW